MPYITLAQLEDRFGTRMLIDLTDRGDVATGSIDTDTIERALLDTDSVINGHIATRYALPIAEDSIPPLLTDIAGAIAVYKLHRYDPDAKITRDRDTALMQLRQIADGQIKLPLEGTGDSAPGTGGSGARVTDRERPFTEENMKGFI